MPISCICPFMIIKPDKCLWMKNNVNILPSAHFCASRSTPHMSSRHCHRRSPSCRHSARTWGYTWSWSYRSTGTLHISMEPQDNPRKTSPHITLTPFRFFGSANCTSDHFRLSIYTTAMNNDLRNLHFSTAVISTVHFSFTNQTKIKINPFQSQTCSSALEYYVVRSYFTTGPRHQFQH